MIVNKTHETTNNVRAIPQIVNNKGEYSHSYKRRNGQVITIGASTINGDLAVFISIDDDKYSTVPVEEIVFPSYIYQMMRDFVNHPDTIAVFETLRSSAG
jgi:hypothetical protein